MMFNILVCLSLAMAASGCAIGFMDMMNLEDAAKQICNEGLYCPTNNSRIEFIESGEWIMPRMKFKCKTNIIGLYLIGKVESTNNTEALYPNITLWKNDNGVFTIRNTQEIHLGPNDFATNGIFHYTLPYPMPVKTRNILGLIQPDDSPVQLQYVEDSDSNILSVDFGADLNSVYESNRSKISGRKVLIFPEMERSECSLSNSIAEYSSSSNTGLRSINENVLFKDLHINCTGEMTRLIVGARKNENNGHTTRLSPPVIEIWRQHKNHYNKVHAIPLHLSSKNEIEKNVYSYVLQPPLPVQSNDIIGIKQRNNSKMLIYYQMNNGPFNYKLTNGSGQLVQIPNRNDYPLLSIVVVTHSIPVTSILILSTSAIIVFTATAVGVVTLLNVVIIFGCICMFLHYRRKKRIAKVNTVLPRNPSYLSVSPDLPNMVITETPYYITVGSSPASQYYITMAPAVPSARALSNDYYFPQETIVDHIYDDPRIYDEVIT